jgi:integrase
LKWVEVDLEHGCLRFADSKTGKSVRPLGMAAVALLKAITHEADQTYVFPAERGDGHFQGYKTPWMQTIKKAGLHSVSPHTLRHTMGSTTISAGEAMAFAGAILGHSNPPSTAIYAHVQHEPAREVADRISTKIAAALAGLDPNSESDAIVEEDETLLKKAADLLLQGGARATSLRVVLGAMLEGAGAT